MPWRGSNWTAIPAHTSDYRKTSSAESVFLCDSPALLRRTHFHGLRSWGSRRRSRRALPPRQMSCGSHTTAPPIAATRRPQPGCGRRSWRASKCPSPPSSKGARRSSAPFTGRARAGASPSSSSPGTSAATPASPSTPRSLPPPAPVGAAGGAGESGDRGGTDLADQLLAPGADLQPGSGLSKATGDGAPQRRLEPGPPPDRRRGPGRDRATLGARRATDGEGVESELVGETADAARAEPGRDQQRPEILHVVVHLVIVHLGRGRKAEPKG